MYTYYYSFEVNNTQLPLGVALKQLNRKGEKYETFYTLMIDVISFIHS